MHASENTHGPSSDQILSVDKRNKKTKDIIFILLSVEKYQLCMHAWNEQKMSRIR